MSIFQCDRCGCAENTACTSCSHSSYLMNSEWDKQHKEPKHVIEALASYKKILGLEPEQPFGKYCSACCPMWFDQNGEYGIGPNPNPGPDRPERGSGGGVWHGRWERKFLPKGQFETGPDGNLRHKISKRPSNENDFIPEEK